MQILYRCATIHLSQQILHQQNLDAAIAKNVLRLRELSGNTKTSNSVTMHYIIGECQGGKIDIDIETDKNLYSRLIGGLLKEGATSADLYASDTEENEGMMVVP
jgi:hypothetical protein